MKTIFLIRHSVPDKNIKFIDINDNELENQLISLSLEGEDAAYNYSFKYFSNGINYVWSSVFNRSISTAKYIAYFNKKEINVSNLFNERKLGNTEGVSDKFWLTQLYDENVKTIGGESQKEVRDRMILGINKVLEKMNDGEVSLIVSHATAITFLLMNWCFLKNAELKGKKRWLTYNNKTIMNDSFRMPDGFKLLFDKDCLVDIDRIEDMEINE